MARRALIVADLKRLCPAAECVIEAEDEIRAYETDGLSAYRQIPLAVVLPRTTEEVAAVMRYCHQERIPVTARGAGTSLAGGAMPTADGVVLGLMKLNAILDLDFANRTATVEAGVTNIAITQAVEHEGFFYAPDPSSQLACSIGGNVANNSGGAHCLKYGVTTNNLLGVKLVTVEGDIVEIGGKHLDAAGYDLLGLLCGSEGQLGVVTEVTVRILKAPEGARPMLLGFKSNRQAGACVDAIIASGIIPVALEFMDKPAIHAVEAFVHAGYPLDVEAVLIAEVEGNDTEIDDLLARITKIAKAHDASYLRVASNAAEAAAIWKGRKSAFGAVGRISPDYICIDGTIPTSALPETLDRIGQISRSYGLEVANIFHAGDGNLHPLILYNANAPGELEKAEQCSAEILKLCVDVGGCLSGEHGVGIEKRDLMDYQFEAHELALQKRIKAAFDPHDILNVGKVFPLEDATTTALGRAA
ncbi:MAG: FAD-binding protein [Geminicoccaceae bacterium]|nr:MAG: FAD-binding protein [Geminicoccaceae bacterium]